MSIERQEKKGKIWASAHKANYDGRKASGACFIKFDFRFEPEETYIKAGVFVLRLTHESQNALSTHPRVCSR